MKSDSQVGAGPLLCFQAKSTRTGSQLSVTQMPLISVNSTTSSRPSITTRIVLALRDRIIASRRLPFANSIVIAHFKFCDARNGSSGVAFSKITVCLVAYSMV